MQRLSLSHAGLNYTELVQFRKEKRVKGGKARIKLCLGNLVYYGSKFSL